MLYTKYNVPWGFQFHEMFRKSLFNPKAVEFLSSFFVSHEYLWSVDLQKSKFQQIFNNKFIIYIQSKNGKPFLLVDSELSRFSNFPSYSRLGIFRFPPN